MFRGWLALGDEEIANTSRVVAHMTAPTADGSCPCPAGVSVQYDDSWPGLPNLLGHSPYQVSGAPWYDPAIPQSAEFLGVWATAVEGGGATLVSRTVNDAVCPGGVSGPHRDQWRTVTVEALLIACTHAGVTYGLEWLECQLAQAKTQQGGMLLFLDAHPENSSAVPLSLFRTYNRVVLTRAPAVKTRLGLRGRYDHRQSSVHAIDFELAVLDPYTYGPGVGGPLTWTSQESEQITWVHAPDCANPLACSEIPVLGSVECVPNIIDTRPVQPPVCTGCIPVCEVQTSVAPVPSATGFRCRQQVVTLSITAGPQSFSGSFWLQPCGSTAVCDRTGFLSIAGLPANSTVVADSLAGRPHGLVGGQKVRQRGIVSTPSGAPWTSVVVDSSECWELVAQTTPGAAFTVEVEVRGRK